MFSVKAAESLAGRRERVICLCTVVVGSSELCLRCHFQQLTVETTSTTLTSGFNEADRSSVKSHTAGKETSASREQMESEAFSGFTAESKPPWRQKLQIWSLIVSYWLNSSKSEVVWWAPSGVVPGIVSGSRKAHVMWLWKQPAWVWLSGEEMDKIIQKN